MIPASTRRKSIVERFWSHVDLTEECWLWIDSVATGGYAQFFAEGHREQAHRVAYKLIVGPIPEGLDLDHLCHTVECKLGKDCPHRRCVRPTHLAPSTNRANLRRGRTGAWLGERTHCKNGHPWDERNTGRWNGYRVCRMCGRLRAREKKRRARISH